MCKKTGAIILMILIAVYAFCDTEILETYLQDFYEMEDNAGKVNILRRALADSSLNESGAELFEHALQYALENCISTDNYFHLNNIILTSLNGLRRTDSIENPGLLWELFLAYPVPEIKAEIMIALGKFGKENKNLIENINDYLKEINSIFYLGENIDYITVSAVITALMEMDNSSSYPVLLDVLRAGYPEVIASEASGALDLMSRDLYQFLLEVIKEGLPEEKSAAFRAVISSGRLSISERGELAELALRLTLDTENENVFLTTLRYDAVTELTALGWTRANPLAVRHFYITLADFQRDSVSYRNRFIQAINFLGSAGNSEAALVLGLQLGLINDRKERTGYFDAGITLAIVQALGRIGDSAAFNNLLRASTLLYNENITSAAREAMDRLKW